MNIQSLRGFALSSALALLALPAAAQVTLTPLSLTARSYESVTSWQERPYRPAGLVETVRIPGHMLVDIRAVFDGPWSDSIERVQANTRDILLVLPDGTELQAQGSYPTWGQLVLQARTLSARRPRNFPDEDQDVYWNGLFRVPKGVSTATLRIGGDDVRYEGPVTIPGPMMDEDAASFARFRPTAVRRFRTVALEDGRGDEAMRSTARNAADYAKSYAKDAGVASVNAFIKAGQPARTIVSVAREKKCDLLVVGSRGLGATEGYLLGSVSHKVTGLAHCPVMVV